ncbi:MAG: L-lactate dehydrogenase [bacterium]|nr:L-lactate dehydrogenase [bacterium]
MKNKVAIIGAGMVGSTTAYSLITQNTAEEIVLLDANSALAQSQAMDLQHSVPFAGFTKVQAGTYQDLKDCAIVVIACGAKQKPGETRLDLVKKNSAIMKDVVPKVFQANAHAVLIMVSNPVDILTHQAISLFPKKRDQILGSGTILDSARFRFLLGQHLKINPQSIHAYIVGEHGDSELPLWSTATVGNIPIARFRSLTSGVKRTIFEKAKNAAYAIIEGKQATYYAIASGVAELIETILFDRRTVWPVSHLMDGEFGLHDVALSLPVVLGRQGIVERLPVGINATEKKQLKQSAAKLRKVIQALR